MCASVFFPSLNTCVQFKADSRLRSKINSFEPPETEIIIRRLTGDVFFLPPEDFVRFPASCACSKGALHAVSAGASAAVCARRNGTVWRVRLSRAPCVTTTGTAFSPTRVNPTRFARENNALASRFTAPFASHGRRQLQYAPVKTIYGS